MINLGIILSLTIFSGKNPSLFHPYDVIGDIIDDVISTLKSYIRRSAEFYDIQHG